MENENRMSIDEISAPGAGIGYAGYIGIASMLRKGAVVYCEADSMTLDFEKVIVEFENVALAERFEDDVKRGTARIVLDEDMSIAAAPIEIREGWDVALVAGNKERLEALRKELWEDYGIHAPDQPAPKRETSGVKRLAIMHDHGITAFGFKGRAKELEKWMARNGFDADDLDHYHLDMYE